MVDAAELEKVKPKKEETPKLPDAVDLEKAKLQAKEAAKLVDAAELEKTKPREGEPAGSKDLVPDSGKLSKKLAAKTAEDDGDKKDDLGLVKAKETVLLLVLNGEQTGEAVTGAVVKLLDDTPELPVAETANPKLTSTENYATDVAGGTVDASGAIVITRKPATDGPGKLTLGEVSNVKSNSKITGKALSHQDIPVDQQTFAQVVVTGAPAAAAHSAAKLGLAAKLVPMCRNQETGPTSNNRRETCGRLSWQYICFGSLIA